MGLKKIRVVPPKKTEMGKRIKEGNKRLHKMSGVGIGRNVREGGNRRGGKKR
jgi:hypothetical protein